MPPNQPISQAANWAGNVANQTARVHRPASVDELRAVVAGSGRVRARGSGHSFSALAEADGDLVLLTGLPRVFELDARARTVTVGAGLRYLDFVRDLDAAGYALPNLASLPNVTVAGAVATGTHGSGDLQPCLAGAVARIELVDARGAVRAFEGAELAGVAVSLGALGVVSTVTLSVEPAFEVAQTVYTGVPLTGLAATEAYLFAAAYSVSAFTDWGSGTASVFAKRRTDEPARGWAASWGTPATEQVHPIPGWPADDCTPQLGEPGPWCDRLPHFRGNLAPVGDELQSEFFVPRAHAHDAINAVRGIAERIRPVLYISELRTVRRDGFWLSPAYGRDSLAIHFTWRKEPDAVREAVALVERVLAPYDPRPHWGKVTTMAPEEIAGRYERLGDFRGLAQELDPAGAFRNPFVAALLEKR